MTDAAAQPEAPRIALARAAGVFAATLSSFLAIGAVITILPRYVSGPLAGGDVAVGVIVGAFAFSAVVTRPLAGRLADARGRRRVAIAGALVMAAGGALYFAPLGFGGLMAARLVLGVGDALVVTAGAAWTVDLAPVSRRGQAIGLFGLAIWGGLSLGPPIGEALFALGSYELVWAFAVVAPLVGAVLASRVPDTHVPAPRSAGGGPLIPVASRRPGVALLLANVGYAALAGFVVLHLEAQGDGRGPLVFTVFAVAVVATRLLAGRLPDRLGARRTAVVAALCEAAGLVAVAVAGGAGVAIAGAVLMGIGFSSIYPALALLVIERADPERHGTALGAFTAFFDAGVGLGGPLVGVVVALAGYPAGFLAAAACALAGAVLVAATPGTRTGAERRNPSIE